MVRLELGEETVERLTAFAADQDISAAEVTGIGAYERATVGFYRLDRREYDRMDVPDHTEVLSIIGNLSVTEEGPRVHVHVTLSRTDGTAVGGHLFEGHVGATLEVFVREGRGELRRANDEQIGLPLLDL